MNGNRVIVRSSPFAGLDLKKYWERIILPNYDSLQSDDSTLNLINFTIWIKHMREQFENYNSNLWKEMRTEYYNNKIMVIIDDIANNLKHANLEGNPNREGIYVAADAKHLNFGVSEECDFLWSDGATWDDEAVWLDTCDIIGTHNGNTYFVMLKNKGTEEKYYWYWICQKAFEIWQEIIEKGTFTTLTALNASGYRK